MVTLKKQLITSPHLKFNVCTPQMEVAAVCAQDHIRLSFYCNIIVEQVRHFNCMA